MKKVIQIALIVSGLLIAFGVVQRVALAKAEEKFHLERSRCQLALIKLGNKIDRNDVPLNDEGGEYFVVDWPGVPGKPEASAGKIPRAYDCRMSNHAGRGVNILMVDGTVEWDSNAEWLKKFASDHPNAKLPMPQ